MTAIVLTGATGGLGSSLVEALYRKKSGELICVYRNEKKYRERFSDIIGIGGKSPLHPYRTSPGDSYDGLSDMLAQMRPEEIVLILNAFSITPIKPVGEYSDDDVRTMIDGNILQSVMLANKIVGLCRRRKTALRIINLDSGAADFPLRGWGNYCAAKAYINSLLSVISIENPEFRVVSYDPGVMDTDMQRRIRETDSAIFDKVGQFISYKDEGKLNAPADVAADIVKRYVEDWHAREMREKYRK